MDYSDITEVADEFETKYRDAMSSMQAPRTGRLITKLTFEHCSMLIVTLSAFWG